MSEIGLKIQGGLGIVAILGVAWLLSTDRRAVRPRIILFGLGLQFLFALVVLRTELGRGLFQWANAKILLLIEYSGEGARFVLGDLAVLPQHGGPHGFILAFQTLTTIIFFASLMAVLYHFGIMQRVVRAVAWVMLRTLKTSGAETLSASANIFVGQTEAPLLVKPFIGRMTRSEIMAVMTGGFATVAGGVLATYVGLVSPVFPEIAGHLMAASVMAAPAGIMMAKILVPEVDRPVTVGSVRIHVEKTSVNVVDAAAGGAADGMRLALNVAAMLLAFVGLIYLVDGLLGWVGGWIGFEELKLSLILKYLFAPLAFAMGIESGDLLQVSELLGIKLVATEFTAFLILPEVSRDLSPRSITMTSYALCGFANFASIAIQIGGIGAMAPERRSDLAKLGMRAMFAGFLATCLTAAVAGILM